VLSRGKFAVQLSESRFAPAYLLARYTQLATLIGPAEITAPELRDPDDAAVLACALAAQADLIVSGDKHLRNLKTYQNIPIVNAAEALVRLSQR